MVLNINKKIFSLITILCSINLNLNLNAFDQKNYFRVKAGDGVMLKPKNNYTEIEINGRKVMVSNNDAPRIREIIAGLEGGDRVKKEGQESYKASFFVGSVACCCTFISYLFGSRQN